MTKVKGKSCEKDYNEQQRKQQRNKKEKHSILIEALSNATNVAGNQCFDHNVSTENHPGGSNLRMKLERRWNDLILETSSSTHSTRHAHHEGGSERANKGSHLPTSIASASWLQNIYNRHTEPGRHYHTAVHLWEMFELLDIVIANLCAPKWYVPMAWSVFFHDSIYDPKSNRNEKDSAELFRGFVDACIEIKMDKETFDAALAMILATEKHKVILPSARSGALSKEEEQEEIVMQKHFLDIDMSVLGKRRDAYFKYAALIRKEYEFVPHDVYCNKRAEVLETFLVGNTITADNDSSMKNTSEKKFIFLTEPFRGAFEDQARENLQQEIELLRKNTIPI